jgi:transcriptional regulator GlxA family with amidase domain
MKVKVWVYPDCSISTASLLLEVFATANRLWPALQGATARAPFQLKIESLDDTLASVRSAFSLQADGAPSVEPDDEVLFLPALVTEGNPAQLRQSLVRLAPLAPLLHLAHQRGIQIIASGASDALLAMAGVSDGVQRTPNAAAFAEFALGLVQRQLGYAVAAQCANALLLSTGEYAQQTPGAASLRPPQAHGDRLVRRAQEWIHASNAKPFSLRELADYLCVSERTVIRRFNNTLGTTPGSYAQSIKIDLARRLLERSSMTVAQISERVGYPEYRSFRLLFHRHAGMSPATYRRQFLCAQDKTATLTL